MKWFKKNYENTPYDVQMKAPTLFYVLVVLVLFSFINLLTNFAGSISIMRFISHIVILGVTVFALFLLVRGNFKFSATFYFLFLYSILAVLRIADGYRNPTDVVLVVAVLGSFLVISSFFISSLKVIKILCAVGASVLIYILSMGVYSGAVTDGSLTTKYISFSLIGMITIIIGVISNRLVFEKILNKTLKNLDLVKLKSEKEGELIQSSIEQINKAEILLENSQKTSSSVIEIDRNVTSINGNIIDFDKRVKSSVFILGNLAKSVETMQDFINDQSVQV